VAVCADRRFTNPSKYILIKLVRKSIIGHPTETPGVLIYMSLVIPALLGLKLASITTTIHQFVQHNIEVN
jgi:hypothetical protein